LIKQIPSHAAEQAASARHFRLIQDANTQGGEALSTFSPCENQIICRMENTSIAA
jgi:hypothetical protein